jgi:hypothetical protein
LTGNGSGETATRLPESVASLPVSVEQIAGFTEQTLGRPVDVDENLLNAGFTSVLLVRLWSTLTARLGVHVPVGIMFSASTVRSLTARIIEFGSSGPLLADAVTADRHTQPRGGPGLSRRAARDALRERRDELARELRPAGPTQGRA